MDKESSIQNATHRLVNSLFSSVKESPIKNEFGNAHNSDFSKTLSHADLCMAFFLQWHRFSLFFKNQVRTLLLSPGTRRVELFESIAT